MRITGWLLVGVVALFSAACFPVQPPPGPPTGPTVHPVGTTSPFLSVVTANHGALSTFKAYYQDGYVHDVTIPVSNGPVTDFEHYTCVNPEIDPGFACSPDHLLGTDPEDVGVLGQPGTAVHHNEELTFVPDGHGATLQWRTYEHLAHTQLEFEFADGYELYVVLDQPTHLYDVKLAMGATDAASFTPVDSD